VRKIPRAPRQAIPAHLQTEEASRYDFRLRLDQAGMFVDGDDRHHDAILGEMLAVANDELLDFLKRARIDADASSRPLARGEYAASSVEFDWLAVSIRRISPDTTPTLCASPAWRNSWRYRRGPE